MKALIGFAAKILSLRLVVVSFSLAQTTLWASVLGTAGFGVISTYLSAQVLACLLARLAADNVLVRQYRTAREHLLAQFLEYLMSVIATSLPAGMVALGLVALILQRSLAPVEGLVFLLFVIFFNIATILSRIVLAQKKQVLGSFVETVVPVATSVVLFGITLLSGTAPGYFTALGYLTAGYGLATLIFVVVLRDFLLAARAARAPGLRFRLLLEQDQWHVLGYQTLSSLNGQGAVLAVAALFGPSVTGVFALARRFGSLLTYLNEPGRVYVMPIVPGRTPVQLRRLYMRMLLFSVVVGCAGVTFLLGLYAVVPLPFSTEPPFELYTTIIMAGAAMHVFAGPVGAILAMSGNERINLIGNFAGFLITVAGVALASLLNAPLYIVIGMALSMVAMKLTYTVGFLLFLRQSETAQPTP